ncbi:hypothetical protein GCM10025857_10170 [Alicyclobacillus contaminans]|nr:hypothetical protein GCM10025857_10170 [Alicyclobacillus contaminans]
MLTKRIIPCFDVLDGRVVKHVGFLENRRDAGDPIELAEEYSREGADELVLLDISASEEGRLATHRVVSEVANRINIPLTVGEASPLWTTCAPCCWPARTRSP